MKRLAQDNYTYYKKKLSKGFIVLQSRTGVTGKSWNVLPWGVMIIFNFNKASASVVPSIIFLYFLAFGHRRHVLHQHIHVVLVHVCVSEWDSNGFFVRGGYYEGGPGTRTAVLVPQFLPLFFYFCVCATGRGSNLASHNALYFFFLLRRRRARAPSRFFHGSGTLATDEASQRLLQ